MKRVHLRVRLAMRQGLWGKARGYLEASFVERRDLQTCAELARLLEHLGDRQALARVQQQGFELLRRDLPALSLPTATWSRQHGRRQSVWESRPVSFLAVVPTPICQSAWVYRR